MKTATEVILALESATTREALMKALDLADEGYNERSAASREAADAHTRSKGFTPHPMAGCGGRDGNTIEEAERLAYDRAVKPSIRAANERLTDHIMKGTLPFFFSRSREETTFSGVY